MDSSNSIEKPSIDLESGHTSNEEDNTNEDRQSTRPLLSYPNNVLRNLLCMDGNANSSTREERVIQEHQLIQSQTTENEKSKRSYNNKSKNKKACCKPPRPPKGPSLDASDVKLIKEISQLAMKKRARIERMKALKKMKEIKTSSYSTTSRSIISAMIITILFFIILIFQGLNSKLGSHHKSFQGSPEPSMSVSNSLISVQFFHNHPSQNDINGPNSGSPYTMEQVSGSNSASPI